MPRTSFDDLLSNADGRLLRALAQLGFTHATDVQAAALPAGLEGKDVLVRAKTGSGKTLAYALPIVERILKARETASELDKHATRSLVLVPTRELAEQVSTHIRELVAALGAAEDLVTVCNIAGGAQGKKGKAVAGSEKAQRSQLADLPDVVVATPSRALTHVRSKALSLSALEILVIDEADLILSYGNSADDIRALLAAGDLPQAYQSFLMSATMTADVDELKGVVLTHDEPAVILLDDRPGDLAQSLTQYCVRTSEVDKFLLLYVILKLKLIKGKCLVFVNDTDRSYKVKLFLEKFGIRAGVLNAELPFNSRYHAVQEFNRGVFEYLIATDESGLEGIERDVEDEEPKASTFLPTQPEAGPSTETAQPSRKRKRKAGGANGSSEYGVARGIDFVDVACVINFDLPSSARSYTHRVGRTARAGRSGMALSFVVPKSLWGKKTPQAAAAGCDVGLPGAKRDETIWRRIEKAQKANALPDDDGKQVGVKEYAFDMAQVEGFRYRMESALKSVTSAAIREARVKEIKNEVLNSDKLKQHFEDNPRDLAYLRHDKPLHPARVQSHLKHVPSYLVPRIATVGAPVAASTTTDAEAQPASKSFGHVPFHKRGRGGSRARGRGRGSSRGGSSRRSDPLKTFSSKGRKK